MAKTSSTKQMEVRKVGNQFAPRFRVLESPLLNKLTRILRGIDLTFPYEAWRPSSVAKSKHQNEKKEGERENERGERIWKIVLLKLGKPNFNICTGAPRDIPYLMSETSPKILHRKNVTGGILPLWRPDGGCRFATRGTCYFFPIFRTLFRTP